MRRRQVVRDWPGWTGDDYDSRHQIDTSYTEAAKLKKRIRLYALTSLGVSMFLYISSLALYGFRIPTMFNEITIAMIGHSINAAAIAFSTIVCYITVLYKKYRDSTMLRTTGLFSCFIGISTFLLALIFWIIDLRNMQWYQAFWIMGFVLNFVPQILLTSNMYDLQEEYERREREQSERRRSGRE